MREAQSDDKSVHKFPSRENMNLESISYACALQQRINDPIKHQTNQNDPKTDISITTNLYARSQRLK